MPYWRAVIMPPTASEKGGKGRKIRRPATTTGVVIREILRRGKRYIEMSNGKEGEKWLIILHPCDLYSLLSTSRWWNFHFPIFLLSSCTISVAYLYPWLYHEIWLYIFSLESLKFGSSTFEISWKKKVSGIQIFFLIDKSNRKQKNLLTLHEKTRARLLREAAVEEIKDSSWSCKIFMYVTISKMWLLVRPSGCTHWLTGRRSEVRVYEETPNGVWWLILYSLISITLTVAAVTYFSLLNGKRKYRFNKFCKSSYNIRTDIWGLNFLMGISIYRESGRHLIKCMRLWII